MPHSTDLATLTLLLAAARKHGGTPLGAAQWLEDLADQLRQVASGGDFPLVVEVQAQGLLAT